MNIRKISKLTEQEIKRFWDKVAIADNQNDCWEWKAAKISKAGYGAFGLNGEMLLAHRISYFIFYGVDPDVLMCCHTCDNPRCVNPNHLFLGTREDNMQDCVSKNRNGHITKPESILRGENSPSSKITEKQVDEIIKLYSTGNETTQSISKKCKISLTQIKRIIHGVSWEHLGKSVNKELLGVKYGEKHPKATLTEEIVLGIKKRYFDDGVGQTEIAKEYKLDHRAVWKIVHGHSWKHVILKTA